MEIDLLHMHAHTPTHLFTIWFPHLSSMVLVGRHDDGASMLMAAWRLCLLSIGSISFYSLAHFTQWQQQIITITNIPIIAIIHWHKLTQSLKINKECLYKSNFIIIFGWIVPFIYLFIYFQFYFFSRFFTAILSKYSFGGQRRRRRRIRRNIRQSSVMLVIS